MPRHSKTSAIRLLPCALFALLLIVLAFTLWHTSPKHPPETLKALPPFSLPALYASTPLTSQHIEQEKHYVVLNLFASWCVPCLHEHPWMQTLATQSHLTLYGIAWKNTVEDAKTWLTTHGNPYHKIGMDLDGTVGVSLGITGVPETLLISPEGTVIKRWRKALMKDDVEEILSLITSSRNGA